MSKIIPKEQASQPALTGNGPTIATDGSPPPTSHNPQQPSLAGGGGIVTSRPPLSTPLHNDFRANREEHAKASLSRPILSATARPGLQRQADRIARRATWKRTLRPVQLRESAIKGLPQPAAVGRGHDAPVHSPTRPRTGRSIETRVCHYRPTKSRSATWPSGFIRRLKGRSSSVPTT